jgi:hypothetical protein
MSVAQLSTCTTAFVTTSSHSPLHLRHQNTEASLDYPSTTSSTTQLEAFSRRREVFGNLKKAIFAGAGVASVFKRQAVYAEENATKGRIVEFQVNNLDGEAGKSGTFKVQLIPEWSPRGVARFEVRGLCLLHELVEDENLCI